MGVRTKLVAFEAGSRAVGANGKTRFGMAEIAAAIAAIVIVAVPRAVTGADRAFSALSGSWTGSGVVKWTNGGSERVRCRSVYEPAAGAQLNLRLSKGAISFNSSELAASRALYSWSDISILTAVSLLSASPSAVTVPRTCAISSLRAVVSNLASPLNLPVAAQRPGKIGH